MAATRQFTPAAVKLKGIFPGNKVLSRMTEIADSFKLSLLVCGNVMLKYCPNPLAPVSARPCFQTDSD